MTSTPQRNQSVSAARSRGSAGSAASSRAWAKQASARRSMSWCSPFPECMRSTVLWSPMVSVNVAGPPSCSAQYAASRTSWSSRKPWLNAWLTTSSASTRACQARASRSTASAPPITSYTDPVACSLTTPMLARRAALPGPDRCTTIGEVSTRPWVPTLVVLATVGQLAVAEWWPGIERFADKAFGPRLVAYPLLMLIAPALWWLLVGRRHRQVEPPYGAFTLVMLPFLVDVTGNSLDLYDSLDWWDDANHYVNWLLLLAGLGMLVTREVRPDWAMTLLVTGLGAILAIGWELGEWYTFIRHGTELDTAYEDTLGDLALGTLGSLTAALLLLRRRRLAASARGTASP